MSFENGSLSFRMFHLPHGLPDDCVRRFSKHAMPPIDSLSRGEISGWVTGRHMLDRNITGESAYRSGYLRLTLVKAEKKVPEALLRAECAMEELALMQAENKTALNRAERTAIRKSVMDRLLPKMPPSLSGIPIVFDGNSGILYAGTTTDKQTDALLINLQAVLGVTPLPLTAEALAFLSRKVDAKMLEPTSFSPELEDPLAGNVIGHDFLTWLWFFSETGGGTLDVDGEPHGVMIEGPLTFFLEGQGAHITHLRKGAPLVSSEAKTALLSGKKLTSAKITMGRHHEQWTTTIDASQFVFRGFKIPKLEELDSASWFQQRMISLDRFRKAVCAFYNEFLDQRLSAAKWANVRKNIHQWVSGRIAKK